MKRALLISFLFFISPVLYAQNAGQQVTKSEISTISGDKLKEMMTKMRPTDPTFYDMEENKIDSVEAIKKLKSYEYKLGSKHFRGEYRKILVKVNPTIQANLDSITKEMLKPKSAKLQIGFTLNTRPMADYIDLDPLKDKAVLLIFWCRGCYGSGLINGYSTVNEVTEKYLNPEKLQIITITNHNINDAREALDKSPIINNRHILNAGSLTAAYKTDNRPLIVLTDRNHKILYAIRETAEITPRTLNRLLKEITQ